MVPVSSASADEIRNSQWWLDELDLPRVHDELTTGEGMRIGVIDTGVDADHPDIADNVVPGLDTFSRDTAADGREDDMGHGTGMASLVAGHGHGDGGQDGVLGVAPGAEIVPVRIFPDGYDYYGDHADQETAKKIDFGMVEGIEWLVDEAEVDVIMIALGGTSFPELEDATKYAVEDNNVPIVAGIGNKETTRYGDLGEAPATYPEVFGVSATEQGGDWWDGSVESKNVLLSAPGADITSAGLDGGYDEGASGTSNATAIVAGVVALMRWQWPDMAWDDIEWRITETADHPDDTEDEKGGDSKYGWGIVNPYEALTAEVEPPDGTSFEQINPEPNPREPEDEATVDGGDSDDAALTAADSGPPAWVWIAAAASAAAVLAAVVLILMRRRQRVAATTPAASPPNPGPPDQTL
ncbi:MAG: S8 family serine peptidase [Stackebrandtia sp.]